MDTDTRTHAFAAPFTDTAEICTCGATFVQGFNLQAVKVAHLATFLSAHEVVAQIVAALTPGELADVIAGRKRMVGADRTMDLAIWNAAIDRDNGYDL